MTRGLLCLIAADDRAAGKIPSWRTAFLRRIAERKRSWRQRGSCLPPHRRPSRAPDGPMTPMEDDIWKRFKPSSGNSVDIVRFMSHRIESSSMNALPSLVEEFNKMSLRLSQAEQNRTEMEIQLRQARKMEAIGRLAGGCGP